MNIVTLTLNPALDKSAKVDGIIPEQKLKCHSIKYNPGGGGINISRVLNRLDVTTNCVFPFAGNCGALLNELLLKENIKPQSIPIKAWTRENLAVVDTQTKQQYRFGMPGNTLTKDEIAEIENTIEKILEPNDILVLSGGLAEEMPADYFAKLIRKFSHKNLKIVLDTSGPALKETLKEKVYLMKPNQRELALLAGKDFLSSSEQEEFALELIQSEKAKYVVVSLGARGAFIASKEGVFYQSTPSVSVNSTIGAGDSMVAGLIYSILNNYSPEIMLKWGVACGVAATMGEGTALAHKEDVHNIIRIL
ncbi:1-phosphofructokinase family hexose kinase [Flavobacterium sp. K5-23]|uniref:1-phosphofructokinase family hexose kinase n=1 Tax=Flavobacterium sp. K5-23 TaxID=2746225 RepID=UPI00201031F8|nr:1-phosphofructokinase family hexose kinase [Flavobacterium sp. K5-23]UQD56499.1 1-phosphofructokinase family hexose kinase [Flavobacterium sp. K5-23]